VQIHVRGVQENCHLLTFMTYLVLIVPLEVDQVHQGAVRLGLHLLLSLANGGLGDTEDFTHDIFCDLFPGPRRKKAVNRSASGLLDSQVVARLDDDRLDRNCLGHL
jgi:hypothetical protein